MDPKTKRSIDRRAFEGIVAFETFVAGSGSPRNIRGEGLGVDISDRGMGMTTDCVLSRGDVLRVSLPVDAIPVTLPVYAEVMWTKPEKRRCRSGLRFLI